MDGRAIAQFELEDGTKIFIEVPEPENNNDATEEIALDVEQTIYKASETFEKAIDKVKPVANVILSRLKSGLTTPADEVEVKFGFNLTADANVIFSSIGGQVAFEVTLKWQNKS